MRLRAIFAILLLIGALQAAFYASYFGVSSNALPSTEGDVSLSKSSYENVTTHQGDLVINGMQTFVIENCTYVQTGSIYVRDWAELITRNAEIEMNQSHICQFEFQVENYATIDLRNSSLKSYYALNFQLVDYSKATLSNVIISLGSPSCVGFCGFSSVDINLLTYAGINGIYVQEQSTVSVRNSYIETFGVWFGETQMPTVQFENSAIALFGLNFSHDQTVQINRLEPGRFEFLDLGERVSLERGVVSEPLRITLNQTYVDTWDARIKVGNECARAIISESTLRALDILPVEGFICIEDVRAQFFEWREIGQLTLNKTHVSPYFSVSPQGDSNVAVVNSSIYLYPNQNSSVCLTNSVIEGSGFAGFLGSLFLNHTSLRRCQHMLFSDFYVFGIGRFEIFPSQWFSSNVTRNYLVEVRQTDGEPISDATLLLKSGYGTVIWNGTTDAEGEADFNLTFRDNNYVDTLRLEAIKGNLSAGVNISFLSQTPVALAVGAHNVAMTDVVSPKNIVGQGSILPINVTVMNKGEFTEVPSVTVYANTTLIGTQTVFGLSNGSSKILSFIWHTAGVACGTYILSTYAEPVVGETDTADNSFAGGTVYVGIMGDVNGDWKVDMKDVSYVARRFMCTPSELLWDSIADLNSDGKTDMKDISTVARHFGEHI